MKLCLLLSASLSNAFTTTLSSAKKLSLLLLLSFASISFIQAQTTLNFSPSTTTWTCPVGVTSVVVEAWGAGGAGGGNTSSNDGGGGGGGGAYSKSTIA